MVAIAQLTGLQTRLVVFSVTALDAEATGADVLAEMLGVARPLDWPPPFNDASVRDWFRSQLRSEPDLAPWLGYYVLAVIDGSETLVGTAGYKGPPDDAGVVEIGYSIVPPYQRLGIGTSAVQILVTQAFADARVNRVTAETPVSFIGSRGLLEKSGFAQVGQRLDAEEGELVLYETLRA